MGTLTPADFGFGLLVLARIAGMVFAAPVLSDRVVPIPVKAGLSLSLALMFLPFVDRPATLPGGAGALALGAAGELAIGLLIGFAAAIVLAAAKGAGRMIEQQVGLSLGSGADEATEEGESAWVGFSGLLVAVVFFAINGHHHLIAGTLGSFESIPVLGRIAADDGGVRLVSRLGVGLFATSLHLAGPVILTMLLVSLAAGFVARAVPELDGSSAVLGARAALGIVAVSVGIGAAMSGFANAWLASSPYRVLELVGGRP
jgi:flagellar biosynthetic protein FliR